MPQIVDFTDVSTIGLQRTIRVEAKTVRSATVSLRLRLSTGMARTARRPLRPEEFAEFLGVIVGNANTRAAVLADVFQSKRLRRKPRGVGRLAGELAALAEGIAGLLEDSEDPCRVFFG